MKKIITSLLAFCMCLGICISANDNTNVMAMEHIRPTSVNKIQESDWPDYNYGNWKDVAENPKKYAKAFKCLTQVAGFGAIAALSASGGPITFWSVLSKYGLPAAWGFTTCMWS